MINIKLNKRAIFIFKEGRHFLLEQKKEFKNMWKNKELKASKYIQKMKMKKNIQDGLGDPYSLL